MKILHINLIEGRNESLRHANHFEVVMRNNILMNTNETVNCYGNSFDVVIDSRKNLQFLIFHNLHKHLKR